MRLLLVPFAWVALATAAQAADKPNILVLLTDDLGYGDLGCYGHPMIRTPNLDKLARQGVLFTQCYTASPVCSPSRAGLLALCAHLKSPDGRKSEIVFLDGHRTLLRLFTKAGRRLLKRSRTLKATVEVTVPGGAKLVRTLRLFR